jgi:fumarate hydratase class II
MGNDVAITVGGANGNFELNVYKPVMIHNFLHSVRLLKDACHMFVEHCVNGIEVNKEKISWYVNNSLMLVTAISPKVGYDNAAKIAHTAHHEGISLKQACVKLGFLSEKEFDALVKPETMTKP